METVSKGYRPVPMATAIGTAYEFEGPGMQRYASAHCIAPHDAEAVARMLARAYEAGREAKAKELREVLGIYNTPWGIKI